MTPRRQARLLLSDHLRAQLPRFNNPLGVPERCDNCWQWFEVRDERQRFCSEQCRKNWQGRYGKAWAQ